MINIFIGYDPREAASFSVLSHSIHNKASQPVRITPLILPQLHGIMTRERDAKQSTDFAFSRFIVPYLSEFKGWSIFMDCDMLVREDIINLWSMRDDNYAVMCVKHDHKPKETTKFLGQQQTTYQKKNWSSVMIFNNEKCTALTPEYVNKASGLELHQFKWLHNDGLIGELPHKWNHLVGYDYYDTNAALVHFNVGGPYFNEYKNCEYSEEWQSELDKMLFVENS